MSDEQIAYRDFNRRQILKYGLFGGLVSSLGTSLWINGCRKQRLETKKPNIIFISVDTLRSDHLASYGYKRLTSPFIDDLAQESVRFSKAYSVTSWTLPSHMSMMTSQYPHVHKVQRDNLALSESVQTLAEILSDSGYYNCAFISWIYVSKRFGFGQGFNEFHELLPPLHLIDSSTRWSYKAEKVTNCATDWLKENRQKPFFLFLHYFDPHINYEPPSPYNRMFDPDYKGEARGTFQWLSNYIKGSQLSPKTIKPRDLQRIMALYDGEICYTDTHIWRLLAALDKKVSLDNCLVIVTSDHGEEFNDHGSMEGHQWTLYDEVVHVPLILRFPHKEHISKTVDSPVELIDIAPTILDYLGIEKPSQFQGQSLMKLIEGKHKQQSRRLLYAETSRHTFKQSIRTDRYKLIHTDNIVINKHGVPVKGGYEMYDTKNDPLEKKDIYDKSSQIAQMLISNLDLWKSSGLKMDDGQKKQPKVELSPEEIMRLRSLGYVD